MKNEPGISICIPSYNGEKYLRECLDSCLNQTLPAKEILVVDDGSSDQTPEIVKAYQLRHPHIKYYQNEKNLGLVGNWNRCIDLAREEWIKFVFQDDYLSLNCLEKFCAQITDTSFLLVSKRSFILPENVSKKLSTYYKSEVRTFENTHPIIIKQYISANEISRLAVENICLNFIGEPSLTLFKKSIVNEVGYFNADLAQICDLEFLQRVGTRHGITYIPEKLCHFRIHSDSTTSSNLGSKSFILSHIDPIILVHQMLFDTVYTPFRNSLTWKQLFKLRLYLKIRTYESLLFSEKSTENKLAFAKTRLKFEEINKRAVNSISSKCIYTLLKLKRRIKS
ncbi:MAG: glycosyltransferase family 2 protein [Bacteroidetes bacterium]|nr:glycosyltransferase family 2 protein [Bacteroidota bacterium]